MHFRMCCARQPDSGARGPKERVTTCWRVSMANDGPWMVALALVPVQMPARVSPSLLAAGFAVLRGIYPLGSKPEQLTAPQYGVDTCELGHTHLRVAVQGEPHREAKHEELRDGGLHSWVPPAGPTHESAPLPPTHTHHTHAPLSCRPMGEEGALQPDQYIVGPLLGVALAPP